MVQQSSFAQSGQLKVCSDASNCVSSQANDSHAIEPFLLVSPSEGAWQKVISILSKVERVTIIHTDDKNIQAEAISLIFRFVDDIDFVFNKTEKRIDIRSASRIGYSDFGVNRKRLEALRLALQKANVIQ